MSKYVAERSKYQLFVEFLCRRNKWTNFLRRREILPNATLISTRRRRLRTRETTGIRCGLIGHGTTKIQARGWRERERRRRRRRRGQIRRDRARCAVRRPRSARARLPTDVIGNWLEKDGPPATVDRRAHKLLSKTLAHNFTELIWRLLMAIRNRFEQP